jgi:uncharacterized protein (DUF427 family)
LVPSDHSTDCPHKGKAAYFHLAHGDRRAENAVWTYPEPIESAAALEGYVAFYRDRVDAIEVGR